MEIVGRHPIHRTLFAVLLLAIAACNPGVYAPPSQSPTMACATGMERVDVVADDGNPTFGWYRPAADEAAPTLVMFHGNASDIGANACAAAPYVAAGFGVFLLSYRGYAGAGGEPTEAGLYSDARAALRYLRDEAGLSARRLVLHGRSLGAAVATRMAIEPGMDAARAVVLISPFTSFPAAAADVVGVVPAAMLSLLYRDGFDSLRSIAAIEAPLLIIHGDADATVSFAHACRLRAMAGTPEPLKRLKLLSGKGHNDIYASSRGICDGRDDACAQSWVIRFVNRPPIEDDAARCPERPS